MFYYIVTDKAGQNVRTEDAMEENISSDNRKRSAVKLTRAQKYGSAPVEGSTFMPSDDNASALFAMLTEQEQKVILDSIKSLLSARRSISARPTSTGS